MLKYLNLAEQLSILMALSGSATSSGSVLQASPLNHESWVFLRHPFTLATILSQNPPHHGVLSKLNFHSIRSRSKFSIIRFGLTSATQSRRISIRPLPISRFASRFALPLLLSCQWISLSKLSLWRVSVACCSHSRQSHRQYHSQQGRIQDFF